MNKIVVIDGLARSGTTLLSSLIHSQESSKCYRGVFHEFLACNIGKWKRDYALHPIITTSKKLNIIDQINYLTKLKLKIKDLLPSFGRFQSFCSMDMSLESLKENTLKTLINRNQTDYFTIKDWKEIINFYNFKSLEDLDNFYQILSTKLKVNLLAFRWNQGYPFALKWLRNPNHYWVSVIRHPIQRSLSDNLTFNESHNLGIRYTKNFAKIVNFKHPRHLKIYFDDLILSPEQEIKKIFKKTNVKLEKVNLKLVQQSGKEYKIESSDLVLNKKKHIDGRKFNGFEKNKLSLDYSKLPNFIVKEYEKIILDNSIYHPYSPSGRLFKSR